MGRCIMELPFVDAVCNLLGWTPIELALVIGVVVLVLLKWRAVRRQSREDARDFKRYVLRMYGEPFIHVPPRPGDHDYHSRLL
jgi:membrane protein implicated in regulation of membrane protease activity